MNFWSVSLHDFSSLLSDPEIPSDSICLPCLTRPMSGINQKSRPKAGLNFNKAKVIYKLCQETLKKETTGCPKKYGIFKPNSGISFIYFHVFSRVSNSTTTNVRLFISASVKEHENWSRNARFMLNTGFFWGGHTVLFLWNILHVYLSSGVFIPPINLLMLQ